MEQKSKTYIKKKVKRGKNKEISSYELLLRNSHELLWRKLSEYTLLSLGVVRLKVWLPDLKLASSIKLERGASVDSAISYIARKKKITNPHCGLYLDRHGECGIWLENNTPLWLYDIQASDVLEFKTRPAHNTTTLVIRVFIVEQKVFKSVAVDKLRKVSELVSSFQTQFGLIKGDLSYYGFNLLTPEANEIWLEDNSTLSSYLVHNMSVVEYKRKPIIVLEPLTPHPSIQNSCVLLQSVSVLEATTTIGKWLMPEIDPKEFEEQGLFYMQQNWWMEKDTPIGVYPFKQNDVISIGLIASDNAESLSIVFAAPARKNLLKNQKISALPGEVPVFKVSNVLHLSNFTSFVPATLSGGVVGDITISNYRLTFCALQSPEISIEIPVASIARVEKGKNKNEIFHGYFLDILCKDNRLVRFYWPQHDDSRKKLCQTLKQLAFPGDQLKLFAFYYDEEFVVDGWSIYNFEAEYERQGILSPKMWRISHMNANYRMCETYPPLLAVPCQISDEQLREVFQFRSKGRIPVMTWQHPTNGTSISRCSQPLSGIRVTRCTEDEALIKHLGYSARSLVVDKLEKDLYVLDCRPKANALGNRAKGAGYEDTTTSYPNCILEFLDIGNIHVMRESYEKLLDICLTAVGGAPGGGWSGSGPSGWLLAVESTKWLDHICTILKAAERVVDCIHNQEISVLLHCSDGWDRTAQVGSLALILLDPYHRTTRGFALLIEKEWLAFGHKFAQRNGHGDSKHMDERSPVFLQFLDCVWQIMQQFPYAFEFNEAFLIAIITHLHSCRFGTFLFNCHRDRSINYVREKTPSLWSMLLSPPYVHEYANPQDGLLQPNISPRYMQLWTRAHLSWYCAIPPSVDTKLRQHAQNQARTIDKLTRQIEELKCQIDPSRVITPASLPKTISSELKYSDSPIRIIAKNHIARTTLNGRTDSGNLHLSGSSMLQNSDSGFLAQNIRLSDSLSSGINRLAYSGSESSIASELSFNNSSLLRGDSPFQRFREDSSYSSEDDNSDEEDPYSSVNYNLTHSLMNNDAESSKSTTNPSQQKTTRSPSANSRRQLEIPISNFSSSSVSVSSSALHLRVPNSNHTSHKKSASSSNIPYSPPSSPRIIPRSPKLLPFSDMEEPSSPSLSNSGGYPRAKGDSKSSANCLSHGGVEPSNSTSSSPTEEEPRWLRRSPSSKSLNFLDHRRLPPTINPNRFSST